MENKEEICPICNAYDYFEQLKARNFDPYEAFHNAIGLINETVVQPLTIEETKMAFEEGFLEGTKLAYRGIAEELNNIADSLDDDEDDCKRNCEYDECDCYLGDENV